MVIHKTIITNTHIRHNFNETALKLIKTPLINQLRRIRMWDEILYSTQSYSYLDRRRELTQTHESGARSTRSKVFAKASALFVWEIQRHQWSFAYLLGLYGIDILSLIKNPSKILIAISRFTYRQGVRTSCFFSTLTIAGLYGNDRQITRLFFGQNVCNKQYLDNYKFYFIQKIKITEAYPIKLRS